MIKSGALLCRPCYARLDCILVFLNLGLASIPHSLLSPKPVPGLLYRFLTQEVSNKLITY
jgi:hypothetical protein